MCGASGRPGSTHEIFEPQNLTATIVKIPSIMTKSTIQSLKTENDGLKSQLAKLKKYQLVTEFGTILLIHFSLLLQTITFLSLFFQLFF